MDTLSFSPLAPAGPVRLLTRAAAPTQLVRVVVQPSTFRQAWYEFYVPQGASLLEILLLTELARRAHDGAIELAGEVVISVGDETPFQQFWHVCRPQAKCLVSIHLVPDDQRQALMIGGMLAITALVIAAPYAAPLIFGAGVPAFVGIAAGAAIGIGGYYALNSFLPMEQEEALAGPRQVNTVTAQSNGIERWAPIPVVLGTVRVTPRAGAQPYTEPQGSDVHMRILLFPAKGRVAIDEIEIGETEIGDLSSDIDHEIRQGTGAESNLTLFTRDATEINPSQSLGELRHNEGQVQTTGLGTTRISLDVEWPRGIYHQGSKKRDPYTVVYTLEISPAGAGTWTDFLTGSGSITKHTQERETDNLIRRNHVRVIAAGQYDVRVTRTNGNHSAENPSIMIWSALRSFQPNNPWPNKTIAALALRVKKTGSGVVPRISMRVRSYVRDWNGVGWLDGQISSNPASLALHLLTGSAQINPVSDDQVDLDSFATFHEWCEDQGFAFNGLLESVRTTGQHLANVLAAGRGRLVMIEGKYGVAIDRPDKPIVGTISPRNSFEHHASHRLDTSFDGFRCLFFNQLKDFEADERIVLNDGLTEATADYGKVEVLDFTDKGITHPDHVYRHARYRIAERQLRPGVYSVKQGKRAKGYVPGDCVAYQSDIALLGLGGGRITALTLDGSGSVIGAIIDDDVTMEANKTYEVRATFVDNGGEDKFPVRGVHTDVAGVLFAEAWSGTNGAAWSTARWNTADPQGAGSAVNIQSNAGRLLAQGEAGARARIIANSGPLIDFELTAQVTIATGGQTANNEFHNLNFRASGGWSVSAEQDRLDGYSLEFRTASGTRTFQLVSVVNSARTTLGSVAKSFGTSPWSIRIRCIGSEIKCRAWQGTEPETWDIEVTNTTHSAGDLSLATVNGADGAARTATWDALTVTSLDAQPGRTLRFTEPFLAAEAPGIGDELAFGETDLSGIRCLIKDILPGPEDTAEIILIDEAPGIYDAADGAVPEWDSQITRPADFYGTPPDVPEISSIAVRNVSHPSQPDLVTQQQIVVHRRAVGTSQQPPTGYEIEIKRADQDVYQRRLYFPADVAEMVIDTIQSDALYDVRLRATGQSPRGIQVHSNWSAAVQIFVPLPQFTYASTARVAGLELQGQENDTSFTGSAAHFVWRITATTGGLQIHGGESQLLGFVDPAFAWFEVKVIDPATAYVRRTELTTTPQFVYSLADNKEDSIKQAAAAGGTTRPLRRFTLQVRFTDRFGRQGPGASLTVENPAPETPGGLIVSGKVLAINIRTDPPEDEDFEGTVVYVGTGSGFDPGAPSTLVFKDLSNTVLIANQPGGVTRFVRVAHADRFSQEVEDLNLSSEIAVVIEAPEGPPRFVADGIRFTFQASSNIVRWTSGTVYVLDGSTVTPESVSAGQATRTSGALWLYYVRGFQAIQATTNAALANQPDRLALAIYYGGKRLTRINGDFPVANQVSERVGGAVSGVGRNEWVTLVAAEPITTAGNPVTIQLGVDAFGSAGGGETHSIELQIRVQRISLTPVTSTLRTWVLDRDSTASGTIRVAWNGSLIWIDSPAAGTYTYRLQGNFSTSGPLFEPDSDWIDPMIVATESLF